jgi:hypothetical protein
MQPAETSATRGTANAERVRGLSDDQLIAQVESRGGISPPHSEMEMQRRLKEAIVDLTQETTKARWRALWGSVAIAALTVALIALTIVLALKA